MKKIFVSATTLVTVTAWAFAFFNITNEPVNFKAVATQIETKHVEEIPVYQDPSPAKLTNLHLAKRDFVFLPQNSANGPQVLGAQTVQAETINDLNQEQAISLTKPGVVHIINSMAGTLAIPDFDIDIETFKLTPRTDLYEHEVDIDIILTGSGFVVNTDGFIVTNAHVVSKQSAIDTMEQDVKDHFVDLFRNIQDNMSDGEYENYEQYLNEKYGVSNPENDAKLSDDILTEIEKYIDTNLEDNVSQNIVIVDRSQKGNKLTAKAELSQVFSAGLPAKIIDFDKNYKKNSNDVALIRVSEKNLPALMLGNSENLSIGEKAISLGFPSNAKINEGDLFEPTFSEGVISAIKSHEGQKIIQLDNKISPGSSGGPLINKFGEVIGIVTFETGNKDLGDNFGFALPIELAKAILQKNEIKNELGNYRTNLLLGLMGLNNSTCKKALDYFNAASQTNLHFPVKDQLTKPISECENLIANRLSKDSSWDIFRIFVQQHLTNAIIFTLLAMIILSFGAIMLIRFFKHFNQHNSIPSPPPPKPI